MPRLKRLTLKGWGAQSERSKRRRIKPFVSTKGWPARTSVVEELVLGPGCPSTYEMRKLVSACTALKKFECNLQFIRGNQYKFWYKQISNAPLDHAHTLERIILVPALHENSLVPEALWRTSSWTSLKMLQISYRRFGGQDPRPNIVECLPPSLEYFVLHFTHIMLANDGIDVDSFVTEICEALYTGYLEGSLPCLKGVELTADCTKTGIYSYPDPTAGRSAWIPRPDVRHIISAFDVHQIKLGVSMYAGYNNSKT
ncbi:hypothetical protein PMIN03_009883 [Paraphaeosphaeria minitans]